MPIFDCDIHYRLLVEAEHSDNLEQTLVSAQKSDIMSNPCFKVLQDLLSVLEGQSFVAKVINSIHLHCRSAWALLQDI